MSNTENDIVSKLSAFVVYDAPLSRQDVVDAIERIKELESSNAIARDVAKSLAASINRDFADQHSELIETLHNAGIPVSLRSTTDVNALDTLRDGADAQEVIDHHYTRPAAGNSPHQLRSEDKPVAPRTRNILHVIAGDKHWHPTQPELEELANKFLTANLDPLGAVVTTRDGIVTQLLERNDYTKGRILHVLCGSDSWVPTTAERDDIEGTFKTALADNDSSTVVVATRDGVAAYWL